MKKEIVIFCLFLTMNCMSCYEAKDFHWEKISEQQLASIDLGPQVVVSAKGTGGLFYLTQVTISNAPYFQYFTEQDGIKKYGQIPALDTLRDSHGTAYTYAEIIEEDRQDGKLVIYRLFYKNDNYEGMVVGDLRAGSLKYKFFIPKGSITSGYNIKP